jgi:oxygen-independent coproporphyrinogen III oxidase
LAKIQSYNKKPSSSVKILSTENIYIHVPFCASKCGYCAFYSEVDSSLIDAYLDKLESQLTIKSTSTVFLGGGTPSLLSTAQLERLFKMIPVAEVESTIECNPETITPEKAELIKSFTNRISVGVQSFDTDLRLRLGRRAGDKDIANALSLLQPQNIDLIYGIPGQTNKDFLNDLETAVQYGIKHISCYALTGEEVSALFSEHREDDKAETETWHLAGEFLGKYGIKRYEVSNYAVPGYECKHNMNVWHGKSYTGFGPSACSFDGTLRRTEASPLQAWLDGAPAEIDELSPAPRNLEVFAMGLRTVDGWTKEQWESCALPEKIPWHDLIEHKALRDFAEITSGQIKLTIEGLLFWDAIASELL